MSGKNATLTINGVDASALIAAAPDLYEAARLIDPAESRPRVTHVDVSWWNIPEQAQCACGHVKAEHERARPFGTRATVCSECGDACYGGFLSRECAVSWSTFSWRVLRLSWAGVGPERTALGIALKWSGLGKEPTTWDAWLARSARAWKAWQDAGRPMRAFGKDVSHGPVSIPALEGSR